MHSKFVLLLLAALQVSYSSQWERPHIRYYSGCAKHTQSDPYEDQPPGSSYGDLLHPPLTRNGNFPSDHYEDIKPVHEDQREDVPSRSDSFLRDEQSHIDEESAEGQSEADHVYLQQRARHDDCEILVNPIRPPYQGPTGESRIGEESAEGQNGAGQVYLQQTARHDDCEILVNPIRPPYQGPTGESRIGGESAEGQNGAGQVYLQQSPRHDECKIFINPIRPPYQGPNGKLPIQVLSSHSVIDGLPASELGASISGRSLNQAIQASIAQSAINQQISAAGLRAGASPKNALISSSASIGVAPLLPFLPSGVGLPINQPILGPSLPLPSLRLVAPNLPSPAQPSPNFCIRHRLVPVPVRVVEDCITNVPVVRKTLSHQVETVTRHVPVFEKAVTHQQEKIVRHVPVTGKTLRNVVETRVRHIPVIKSRTRTVVEPYTMHVPVTIRFTRPVEESIVKTVPVQEVRVRPVIIKRTRLVPVVERRVRPIVEQRIHNVPVKKKYLRTVVEQRVRPVVAPCQPCVAPLQPIGLPMSLIPAEEIPRILLSPYSEIAGASSGSINSQLGAAISGGPESSGNALIPGPINGQISASSGEHSGIPGGQPICINSGEFSLPPSAGTPAQIGIPRSVHPIIQNVHETECHPRPPSC